MCKHYNKQMITISNIQMFFLRLDYIIRLEISVSLDDSGKPLGIVNVCRVSPNFCDLLGYLSPPTKGRKGLLEQW